MASKELFVAATLLCLVTAPAWPQSAISSEENLQLARIAWRYFERNYQPETGMVNAVDGFPSTTMWDTASYLLALHAANQLDLISARDFDDRMTRLLATLNKMPLYQNELPNKTYHTQTLALVNYANQPVPDGIGWSALDLGRMLVALKILKTEYPVYAKDIDSAVLRWNLARLFSNGQMYGTVRSSEGEAWNQEGRVGYEQYSAKGFREWGFEREVAVAADWQPYALFAKVYSQLVPYDKRSPRGYHANVTVVSENYILDGLEFGFDAVSRDYARRVYQAQEDRYRETGLITAASEDHLDRPPHFVYNTVFTLGEAFKCITEENVDANQFKSLSTKAAFGWRYLYNTPYSNLAFDSARTLYDPEKGFYAGRWEVMSGVNRVVTENTNGIILEAILSAQQGGPLLRRSAIASAPSYWDWYVREVNALRALPASSRVPPDGSLLARMRELSQGRREQSVTELAQARQAWKYFEKFYHPETGLVDSSAGFPAVDMSHVAGTLAALVSAEQLGILSRADFDARLTRLLDTLGQLRLYNGELPNLLYHAGTAALADYEGRPSDGLGWSSRDLGRLMTWLFITARHYPERAARIRGILDAWDYSRLVKDGFLQDALRNPEGEVVFQAGRVGYEQYAARGLALWGIQAERAAAFRPQVDYKLLELFEIPGDVREGGMTLDDPYYLALMEQPWDEETALYASHLYRCNESRFRRTGILTCGGAENVSRAPWFLYTCHMAGPDKWTAAESGRRFPARLFSSKSAFAWDALLQERYSARCRETAAALLHPDGGFYGGLFEANLGMPPGQSEAERNDSLNLHSNSVILESLWYRARGNFTQLQWVPGFQGPDPELRVRGTPRQARGAEAAPTQAVYPATPGQRDAAPIVLASDKSRPLNATLTYSDPLNGRDKPSAIVGLTYNPYSNYFINVSFYQYLSDRPLEPFEPEFSYALGYFDWRPDTLSLIYSNYAGNRLTPGPGEAVSDFKEGTLSLEYKFRFPEKLILKVTDASNLEGRVSLNHLLLGQTALGLGVRYTLDGFFFAAVTSFLYEGHSQGEFDPDYIYSFGYFDWRDNSFSLQYNNYAANRYPWRKRGAGFLDGSLNLTWSKQF